MLAIDFETYLISNEMPNPKPVCLSWYDGTNKGLLKGLEDIEEFLLAKFEAKTTFIAHNATFELLVIYTWFPKLRPYLWACLERDRFLCTKLNEQLLNNVREKQLHDLSLAGLVLNYFDIDISSTKTDPDAWRLRYSELEGVTEWPKEAEEYAIQDSVYAYDVYKMQDPTSLLGWNVKCEFVLNLTGSTGLLIDKDRVNQLEKEIMDYLTPRYNYLIEQGFMTFEKGKYKTKMKLLQEYISTNFKSKKKTPKGAISTTGEALDLYQIELPDNKIIQFFREVSVYEKALSAFVSRLKEANPVIRTNYNAIVSSGRTSSRTSTSFPSVNIQQMPRELKGVTYDIRNCFIPRPGYKLVSIDYSGLELASTAHQLYMTLGHSKMQETINSGTKPVDMHSVLAAKIKTMDGQKCSYEEFVAKKKEPGYKEYRQLSKPINLGFPGGIGYDTMRTLLAKDGIKPKLIVHKTSSNPKAIEQLVKKLRPEYPYIRMMRTGPAEFSLVYDELIKLKENLYDIYPELKYFLSKEHACYTTGKTKWMKDEWGDWAEEPMYAFDIAGVKRNYCTYTAFCNGYLMQSPAALGAKEVVYQAVKAYHNSEEVHILAFIHDEIVFEVKDNENKYKHIDKIAEIMIDEMQKVLYSVRIAVEAEEMDYWMKSGGHWSKTYWKNIKDKGLKC